jgi:dienelactone hydrolase
VVLCHGFKGFKDWGFFPNLADRLSRAGFTAVSVNFSSSGVGPDGETFSELDRFSHGTISNDLADLDRVITTLAAGTLIEGLGPVLSIGLFGHSRGGGTAVLYAGVNSSVPALVTWAATARANRWDDETQSLWRATGKVDVVNTRTGQVLPLHTDLLEDVERRGSELDAVSAARRVAANWLIVHGADDESVSKDEAAQLYDAASKERSKLMMIPAAGHTFGASHPWSGLTAQLEAACDATTGWFAEYLF